MPTLYQTTETPFTPASENPLFVQGYRTFFWDGSLFVHKPNSRTRYMVNPYAKTCTCPARGVCKHLTNLLDLVFASMDLMGQRGLERERLDLCDYWLSFSWAVCKGQAEGIPQWVERIEAEKRAA